MSMVSPNHRSNLSLILGSAVLLANGCADLSPNVYSPTVVPNKWSYAALAGSAVGAVAGNKMSSTARTLLGAGTDFASAHGALGNEILKQQMTPQQPASQINIYGSAQPLPAQSAQQQASALTYSQGAQGAAAAQPPVPISVAQQRANLEALLLQAQDEYRHSIANFDWNQQKFLGPCLLYTYSARNDLNGNSALDFPEEITFKNIFTTDEQRLNFGIIGYIWRFVEIKGMSPPTIAIVNQHTGKVVSRGECSLIYEDSRVQGIAAPRRDILRAVEYTFEFDKQEIKPGIYTILCQHESGRTSWKESCTFSIIQLPKEGIAPPAAPPTSTATPAPTKSEAALADESNAALKNKLNTLKDMKNAGDVTEEEYQLKRKKLLDEF